MTGMGLSLRELAAALGGDVAGAQVLVPGPGHSARDRSLAVKPSPDAQDGFVAMSFAGDDWRACRDYVRSRLGLPLWEPGDERHQQRTIPERLIDKCDFAAADADAGAINRPNEDDLASIARAQAIWADAGDPNVQRVEAYFKARGGLQIGEFAGHALRFHPRCPWRNEDTGKTDRVPCLIAAFRSIEDDTVTGIHRIRLDRPERWPQVERRMLGIVRRTAIKLCAATNQLCIAEGVETALSIRKLKPGFGPAWALGSVGAIASFPLIDKVTELTICAEAGDASDRAIRICARRWRLAGRLVFVSRSPIGSDHNDYLMAQQKRAASKEWA